MGALKAEVIPVEVDMVPLIDIISLLLMFLVMVSDMAKSATNVKLTLPRADQAVNDDAKSNRNNEGRIVIQLQKQKDSRYMAIVETRKLELVEQGASRSFRDYLEELVLKRRVSMGKDYREDAQGGIMIPVKLRIGEETPMFEVERVMQSLARAKLTNVQYAAQKMENKSR